MQGGRIFNQFEEHSSFKARESCPNSASVAGGNQFLPRGNSIGNLLPGKTKKICREAVDPLFGHFGGGVLLGERPGKFRRAGRLLVRSLKGEMI